MAATAHQKNLSTRLASHPFFAGPPAHNNAAAITLREAKDVNTALSMLRNGALLLALNVTLLNVATSAEPDYEQEAGARMEAWLAVTSWQALKDVQPVVGGSFKSVGYGIGASAHWPLRSVQSARLLLGIEGAVMGTDSDIPVYLDELLARDAYLAASVKWRPDTWGNLSLDAGVAYHLLDIAQLETDYQSSFEFQSWEESSVGPFLGMTWEPGRAVEGRDSGLTLGLRAHFLDFGTVRDEDILTSVILGRDAGKLDGPLIVLRIGYRWR